MTSAANVVSFTPSFLLRKVDPQNVLERYRAGEFSRDVISTTTPRTTSPWGVSPVTKPTGPNWTGAQGGHSAETETYMFRDKGNMVQKVATTNHQAYMVCLDGQPRPRGGISDYNHEPFTDEESVGIPIKMEERTFFTPTGPNKVKVFYMDGCTKTFEESLFLIKQNQGLTSRYRDPLYADSETLLRHLYQLLYPEAPPLQAAPDPRLKLKSQPGHYYKRTGSIVLAPLKVQYIQANLT